MGVDVSHVIGSVQYNSSSPSATPPLVSCTTAFILDDEIAFEGNETFQVELVGTSHGNAQIGNTSVANVTILDNDCEFACVLEWHKLYICCGCGLLMSHIVCGLARKSYL